MNITRRLLLQRGMAGAVAATGAATEAEPPPRQRLEAAVVELKAAAACLWPTANDWIINLDGTPSVPLLITNYDPDATPRRGSARARWEAKD